MAKKTVWGLCQYCDRESMSEEECEKHEKSCPRNPVLISTSKNLKLVLMVILLVLGGLFYWYEYRPSKIRESCASTNKDLLYRTIEASEYGYQECIKSHGINK